MPSTFSNVRNSVSAKAVFIAILILVLLIPVAMIKGVIHDRTWVSDQARADVMRSWGGEQLVAAPVLIVPYTRTLLNGRNEKFERTYHAIVLPDSLDLAVEIRPDTRYRGIHEVTVYSAVIDVGGSFRKPTEEQLPDHAERILWEQAFIAVGIRDARAISKAPQISIGEGIFKFAARGTTYDGLPAQIIARSGNPFTDGEARFGMQLHLNGTGSLKFLPLGDTTTVTMSSSWSSPSFVGSYLPETRDIDEQGFTARWQVSSLGRSMPSVWEEGTLDANLASQAEFGVELFVPVGLYQLSLRATKYAVLFIGLSFVAYFLFEVIAGLRLHPLQYLLVGFANSLFYLLLLSLAEHTGFAIAYLASAVASTALISAYSASVLGQRARALLMALVLGILYSFLYMTLKAENYAMLTGSIGLWVILALVMYLTRRVDWYGNADN
jgi:inner membrane protein